MKSKNKFRKSTPAVLNFQTAILLVFINSSFIYGQVRDNSGRDLLFSETEGRLVVAIRENADILAPNSFSKALEALQKAESDYKKGKKLTDIRGELRIAYIQLNKAIDQSHIARVIFGTALQARFDASKSEAPDFAVESWKNAEEKFRKASQTLEDGYIKNAQKISYEAETIYRKAELEAIKTNYLGKAHKLLEDAKKINVKQYAPKTLNKAQNLVKKAELELEENRSDTDVARVLARQARREARHAIYLATTIELAREKALSWEDILLASEAPLIKIAQNMDVDISFEEGFNKTTERILNSINEQKNNNKKLSARVFDEGQQITLLQARNEELKNRLGGVEKEKSALTLQLEEQEKIRKKYKEVEELFDSREALIFREGNNIRIRLTGLSFVSGKSVIDSKYYSFLGKVIKAIQMFPNSSVIIEGHTDSFGSDKLNFQLSCDRAENVMMYIVENSNINKERIDAVGYGETNPIATNETEEGRAKNRRIAVVIEPELDF